MKFVPPLTHNDGGPAVRSRHVGILIGALPVGSRERIMFALADQLSHRGVRVDILVPGPTVEIIASVPNNVRLIDLQRWWMRVPVAGRRNLLRVALSPPAIAAYLRREQPDVLLSISIPPNLAALTARRLSRVNARLILRQSNVIYMPAQPEFRGVRRRWRDRWIPRLYPAADAVIAVSNGVARNLRLLTDIAPEKIDVIYNGVDLNHIEKMSRLPAEPDIYSSSRVPVLLAVGRLIPKKDYPTLLRAFARVCSTRSLTLVILGEGYERPALERLAKELRIADTVRMPGLSANPYAHMARADLFVAASISEGMPSALIEALACGCPVVSTNCPSGPAEILKNGVYGMLVPVRNPKVLAAAINAALDQPVSRALLQERASHFSSKATVEKYSALVRRIADAGTTVATRK